MNTSQSRKQATSQRSLETTSQLDMPDKKLETIMDTIDTINEDLEFSLEAISVSVGLDNVNFSGEGKMIVPDPATYAMVAECARSSTQRLAITALCSVYHVPSQDKEVIRSPQEVVELNKKGWDYADCSLAYLGWLIYRYDCELKDAICLALGPIWRIRKTPGFKRMKKQRDKVVSHTDKLPRVRMKNDPEFDEAVPYEDYKAMVVQGYDILSKLMHLVGKTPGKDVYGNWVKERVLKHEMIMAHIASEFKQWISEYDD